MRSPLGFVDGRHFLRVARSAFTRLQAAGPAGHRALDPGVDRLVAGADVLAGDFLLVEDLVACVKRDYRSRCLLCC